MKGLGRIFHQQYWDRRGKTRLTKTWHIGYRTRRGVPERVEAVGSDRRVDAVALLKRRLGGESQASTVMTIEDLVEQIRGDYKRNNRDSIDRMERSVKHLLQRLGGFTIIDLTTESIVAYQNGRLAAGAANATVNREMSALKRAFRLAARQDSTIPIPYIPMLTEDNVRRGFFEYSQLEAILPHLSAELQPVIEMAYITGWRVRSEILTRRWSHVDFSDVGWLRLEPGETKNGRGRAFAMTDWTRDILLEQRRRTSLVEAEKAQIVPWVFHRNGKPIRDFYTAWRKACTAAGLEGRIPHDFRRTAVRNLERAGVPRSTAKAMVGHQTDSVYQRYAIVDAGMLHEGTVKLRKLHRKQAGTVVSMKSGKTQVRQAKSRKSAGPRPKR